MVDMRIKRESNFNRLQAFNTGTYLIGCPSGYYGNACIFKCGFCAPGTTCNITDGTCDHGCELGYTGLRCLDGKLSP